MKFFFFVYHDVYWKFVCFWDVDFISSASTHLKIILLFMYIFLDKRRLLFCCGLIQLHATTWSKIALFFVFFIKPLLVLACYHYIFVCCRSHEMAILQWEHLQQQNSPFRIIRQKHIREKSTDIPKMLKHLNLTILSAKWNLGLVRVIIWDLIG